VTRRGSPADPRPALLQAMSLLRAGRLDDTESMLAEVLAASPDHPDALHLSGVCRHERGDSLGAEQLIRKAIDHWPAGDAQVCVPWNNLGNVLVESGRPDTAVDAYRAAVAAQPEASGTWSNLSSLLRRLGRLDEAARSAERAVAAAPGDPHGWFTLARVRIELGDVQEGLQAHARGVALAPRDAVGREEVLRSLTLLGHREEAAALWSEWLEESPDDPIAAHHYAACAGTPPARASDAYIEQVFDNFASSFDAKLATLHYSAPGLVAGVLTEQLGEHTDWGTVADLGCGTGLVGTLIRPRASRLVGVDLSRAMLEQARRRAIYDELDQDELVSFLSTEPCSFDVVVAADVLCYFGVLDEVMAAARNALRPGGTIAFTVESLPDGAEGWSLALHGRYCHSSRYVSEVMADFDRVVTYPCVLRMEAGAPVSGLLVSGRAGAD
jgi:predicted TPR repeat methyltransferase